MDKDEIPRRIRKLLHEMTPTELAAKIGVCVATIYSWKSGMTRPSALALASLEEVESGESRKAKVR